MRVVKQATRLTVPQEEAPANSVPAAAVIRGEQTFSELLGVKGAQAARLVECERPWLNQGRAFQTVELEYRRGWGNSRCSGGMH